MRALVIAAALAIVGGGASAQGYNPANVGQAIVTDCSVTFATTGVPLKVLAQSGTPGAAQGNRTKVILQNLALSRTMAFSFIIGSTLSLSSTQQFVLAGTTTPFGSMWQSGSDLVPMNAIWAIGTAGDTLSCVATGP